MPATPTHSASSPFTVQLKGEGICPAHFKNGQIYLGDYQLTALLQKKLIDLFSESYRKVRARNYAWRLLSSGSDYFTGQLHELAGMSSDENRIRYLFCHAEKDESNKTAEALKIILPRFYQSLFPVPVLSDSIYLKKLNLSESYKIHLGKMEEAFHFLWMFPSVKKVSHLCYVSAHSKYYLAFVSDCRSRIMNSNPGFFANFNPSDNTIERETAESEWAKMLYTALDSFRRCVQKSNNAVSEINGAFDELMKKMHQDPSTIDSAGLKDSQFHHAVIKLRTRLPDIHNEWQKSFSEEENACVHRC